MNTQRHDPISYDIRRAFAMTAISNGRHSFTERDEMAAYCLDRQPLAPAGSTVRSGGYDRPTDRVFAIEPDCETLGSI